jgi:hypothetical protein
MATTRHNGAFASDVNSSNPQNGISKREYFTAAVLTGLLAGMSRKSTFVSNNSDSIDYVIPDALAKEAIAIAEKTIEILDNSFNTTPNER